MRQLISLMKNHRSIRQFKTTEVSDELLHDLIAAGQSAPSSSFIQAYSIIDITDTELREALATLAGNQRYVATAPRFLVFCADLRRLAICAERQGVDPDLGFTEQMLAAIVDTALVAQNVLIAAESVGLGGVYIGGLRNHPDGVIKLLKLPRLVFPVFGMCLGYPEQDPAIKPRLPIEAILHRNAYQDSQFDDQIAGYDQLTRDYYRERTSGRVTSSWSEQMAERLKRESRPEILSFLRSQGFGLR